MFLFSENQKDGQIETQRVSTFLQIINYYRDEAICESLTNKGLSCFHKTDGKERILFTKLY